MPDPMAPPLDPSSNFAGAGGILEAIDAKFAARHGFDVRTVASADTQLATDELVILDTTTAGFTFTLLAPAAWANQSLYLFKKVAANTLTIGGTVNGAVNPTVTAQYAYRRLFSDGTAIYTIGNE